VKTLATALLCMMLFGLVALLPCTTLLAAEATNDPAVLAEKAKAEQLAAERAAEEEAALGKDDAAAADAAAAVGAPDTATSLPPEELPSGTQARVHYEAGIRFAQQRRYDDAIREFQIAKALEPGFSQVNWRLKRAVLAKLALESERIAFESDIRHGEVINDVARRSVPPREPAPAARPPYGRRTPAPTAAMQQMEARLNQTISLQIADGELAYILDLLFRATGVNFIADPAILEGKSLSVHVQNIPLSELLQFITRTLDVSFTTTEHAIWITTPENPIMELRAIQLDKGLIAVLGGGGTAAADDGDADGNGGGGGGGSDTSDLELWVERLPELIVDWPDAGVTYLDKKMNVLYVRATPAAIRDVEDLLGKIDVSPVQVLIETQFIEVSSEDLFDLGIKWDLSADFGLSHKMAPTLDADGNPIPIDPLIPSLGYQMSRQDKLVIGDSTSSGFPAAALAESATNGLNFVVKGVLTDPQFEAVLNALQESGKARVLSAPSIIAVNNSTAQIKVTKDLIYIEDYEVDRADVSGVTLGRDFSDVDLAGLTPEEQLQLLNSIGDSSQLTSEPVIVPKFAKGEETGFILKVTPSVGLDNREITLVLNPDITEEVERKSVKLVFPGVAQETVVEMPVIAHRTLSTRMTIADNSTVVIGGLVSRTKSVTKGKVPLLGDIPLLGAVFRRRSTRDTMTNLLIFCTARILTPGGREYTPSGATAGAAGTAPAAGAGAAAVNVTAVAAPPE